MDWPTVASALILAMLIEQRIALHRMSKRTSRLLKRMKAIDGRDDDSKDGSGGHSITAAFAAAFALLILPGCTFGSKELKQLETGEVHGEFNGQPVAIAWKRDTSGTMTFDVKIPPAIAGAAQGAAGGPWGMIIGGAAATAAAAWGEAQRRAKNDHKADADEGWRRFVAAVEPAKGT